MEKELTAFFKTFDTVGFITYLKKFLSFELNHELYEYLKSQDFKKNNSKLLKESRFSNKIEKHLIPYNLLKLIFESSIRFKDDPFHNPHLMDLMIAKAATKRNKMFHNASLFLNDLNDGKIQTLKLKGTGRNHEIEIPGNHFLTNKIVIALYEFIEDEIKFIDLKKTNSIRTKNLHILTARLAQYSSKFLDKLNIEGLITKAQKIEFISILFLEFDLFDSDITRHPEIDHFGKAKSHVQNALNRDIKR